MTDTTDGLQDLRKPFPKAVTGILPKPYKKESPKQNCGVCGAYHGMPAAHLDYVGHAAVTDRLLTVDPAWTWEPVAFDSDGLPAYDRGGGLWIRLTVLGVTRLGYGDGPDPKQRIGDAIRNAAMRFGVALDLWTKGELESADPNGGDATATGRPFDPSPAEPAERAAERGRVPTDVDPWATVEVAKPPAVTDRKWLADITARVVGCDAIPVLKGLWSEAKVQEKAGHLAEPDAADLFRLMEEQSADLTKAAERKDDPTGAVA